MTFKTIKVKTEQVPCNKCKGTGENPSHLWGLGFIGWCVWCNGTGKSLLVTVGFNPRQKKRFSPRQKKQFSPRKVKP